MKITELKTTAKKEVKDILDEALSMDFDSVIVFGFKNGELFTNSSSNNSRLECIGALEAAKQHLWQAD